MHFYCQKTSKKSMFFFYHLLYFWHVCEYTDSKSYNPSKYILKKTIPLPQKFRLKKNVVQTYVTQGQLFPLKLRFIQRIIIH